MGALVGRVILYTSLAIAIGIVVVSACVPQAAGPTSTPTQIPSATRTATPSPSPAATATQTPAPSATRTGTPTGSPAAACPRQTGGNNSNQAQLVAVRTAHNPGFDRIVYEFGTSTAPGPFGLPGYTIEATSSIVGTSGQPTPMTGNALFAVRFQNSSTQTPTGGTSYNGSNDIKPALPLVKHVRLVEDFERVMVWGVGLDRVACPTVLTLSEPTRVVLDFPTPP